MSAAKPAPARQQPAFLGHCVELLSPLGTVRSVRMFGGHGLYVDELFIAIVIQERLFLKTGEATRAHFEAAGCEPFRYDKQGREMSISYWTAPPDAMDAPHAMTPWARLAVQAALAARAGKPQPKPVRKPAPAAARAAAKTPGKKPAARRRAAG